MSKGYDLSSAETSHIRITGIIPVKDRFLICQSTLCLLHRMLPKAGHHVWYISEFFMFNTFLKCVLNSWCLNKWKINNCFHRSWGTKSDIWATEGLPGSLLSETYVGTYWGNVEVLESLKIATQMMALHCHHSPCPITFFLTINQRRKWEDLGVDQYHLDPGRLCLRPFLFPCCLWVIYALRVIGSGSMKNWWRDKRISIYIFFSLLYKGLFISPSITELRYLTRKKHQQCPLPAKCLTFKYPLDCLPPVSSCWGSSSGGSCHLSHHENHRSHRHHHQASWRL